MESPTLMLCALRLQKISVLKRKAPHWLLNGTYVHTNVRTVTEISCMKTESPSLIPEWYVRAVTKSSYIKTEIPDENLCRMQVHGLLQVITLGV